MRRLHVEYVTFYMPYTCPLGYVVSISPLHVLQNLCSFFSLPNYVLLTRCWSVYIFRVTFRLKKNVSCTPTTCCVFPLFGNITPSLLRITIFWLYLTFFGSISSFRPYYFTISFLRFNFLASVVLHSFHVLFLLRKSTQCAGYVHPSVRKCVLSCRTDLNQIWSDRSLPTKDLGTTIPISPHWFVLYFNVLTVLLLHSFLITFILFAETWKMEAYLGSFTEHVSNFYPVMSSRLFTKLRWYLRVGHWRGGGEGEREFRVFFCLNSNFNSKKTLPSRVMGSYCLCCLMLQFLVFHGHFLVKNFLKTWN